MKNPSRLGMQFVTVVLVVFGIQAAAQTPAVARKPGTPVTAKLSRPASKPPAAAKKISFGVDSFSAKRQLLDARANSLSPQDLENQKKSASAGAPDAMYLMGAYSRNAGDDAAARTWWSQASQRDYLFAMVALAELPGVDASEKRKWLEKAAALGAAPAQFSLGKLLLVSQGGPQELAIGKSMLLKSAQSGCVDAMVLVGASYLGLSREYPGLFEQNPSLAVQYLGAAKLAHSDEARAILHLAVEKGLLPDPFAGKPQLDSGEPFLSYLRQLDKEDRVFYLRQQIARNPQSPLRTKALEEVIWLVPDPSNAPEFAGLKAADPENLTVQLFSLSGKLDREFGRPLVNIEHGDIKTASDVVNRWKKASGFDNLLARTFVLSRETSIVFGATTYTRRTVQPTGKAYGMKALMIVRRLPRKTAFFSFIGPSKITSLSAL